MKNEKLKIKIKKKQIKKKQIKRTERHFELHIGMIQSQLDQGIFVIILIE